MGKKLNEYLPEPQPAQLVLVQVWIPKPLRDAVKEQAKKENLQWTDLVVGLFRYYLQERKIKIT